MDTGISVILAEKADLISRILSIYLRDWDFLAFIVEIYPF